MVKSDKWCTNDCKLTMQFDNLTASKKLFSLPDLNTSQNKENEKLLDVAVPQILSKDNKKRLNFAKAAFKVVS